MWEDVCGHREQQQPLCVLFIKTSTMLDCVILIGSVSGGNCKTTCTGRDECIGGVCTATSFCLSEGEQCIASEECCSTSCSEQGLCVVPQTCSAENIPCQVNGDCCSNNCASQDLDGPRYCQTQPTCVAIAQPCTSDAECCGSLPCSSRFGEPKICYLFY